MLKFVIPQVSELFVSTNLELPAVTVFLIKASTFVENNFLYILGFIFCFLLSLSLFVKTGPGKKTIDYCFISFPILKKVETLKNQSIFAKTLGSLMLNGVSIIQAIFR